MKKLSFCLSLCACLMAAQCPQKDAAPKPVPPTGSTEQMKPAPEMQPTGTTTAPQPVESLPAATATPPTGAAAGSAGSGKGKISPNAAPNQAQMDSIKREKYKAKKGGGGKKDERQ